MYIVYNTCTHTYVHIEYYTISRLEYVI